jgi:acyl-CoA synthetase (AMP-forming)/AMP-acid ligase II
MSEVFSIANTIPKMSELATLNHQTAKARHIVGSVGRLASGCRLRIIDPDTGNILGPGDVGEICVQTPNMLKEYFKRPEVQLFQCLMMNNYAN